MKQRNLFLVFLGLLLCFSVKTRAQDTSNLFVTLWDTQYMSNGSLYIPCENYLSEYFWEKVGSENTVNSSDFRRNDGGNYLSIPAITNNSGVYRLYIKGNFTRIKMFDSSNSAKALIAVESWGNMQWSSMNSALRGCSNLTTLPSEAPNLTNVTDMSYMFVGASTFNSDIGNWDVARVTNMTAMFSNASVFNQNIGNWNVAKVTGMAAMFSNASSFNQNIGNWQVLKVSSMEAMFSSATTFNQDISTWDIGNVRRTDGMFSGASAFNQNIGNWDVDYILSMENMFRNASAFNQNIGGWQLGASVNLTGMLDNSGLNGQNYGLILKTWANNNSTPTGRILGAQGLKYAPTNQIYRDKLTNNILRDGKGWTITDAGVENTLPVNLISLTAKADDNYTKLQWQTNNESNNKGFEIYRSGDDEGFIKIGEVVAVYNSQPVTHIYSFSDKQPLNGNNYYKLIQIDNDGKTTELGIRSLVISFAGSSIQLYPNPASKQLNINVIKSGGIFQIYNLQGKIVMQRLLNQTHNSVDINALLKGLYFYSYGNEKGKFVKE